jgi:hypothetical protein
MARGVREWVQPSRRTIVKITGIILVVLGLVAGVFCLIQVYNPSNPNTQSSTVGEGNVTKPNMTYPLLLSAGAIVVGGAMFFFGGRGYYISNNPRVRN